LRLHPGIGQQIAEVVRAHLAHGDSPWWCETVNAASVGEEDYGQRGSIAVIERFFKPATLPRNLLPVRSNFMKLLG
jgi:hypothetical protein